MRRAGRRKSTCHETRVGAAADWLLASPSCRVVWQVQVVREMGELMHTQTTVEVAKPVQVVKKVPGPTVTLDREVIKEVKVEVRDPLPLPRSFLQPHRLPRPLLHVYVYPLLLFVPRRRCRCPLSRRWSKKSRWSSRRSLRRRGRSCKPSRRRSRCQLRRNRCARTFEGVVGGVVCDAEHCAQHPLGRRIHTVDVCSLWQVVTTEVQRLEQVMVTVDGPPTEIEKIREVMVRHGTTCTRRLVSA